MARHSKPLERYGKKRDFRSTPEPKGRRGSGHRELHFVVQKHAARRLHHDFRLELDGVLLSWAVPKGPCLDPAVKRLAIHVEDHPLEYEKFEGVIPEGEYGGGTVMIWDRGIWKPEGDPEAAYRKGRLSFRLLGSRLKGGWSLVRTARATSNSEEWLLIKRKDAEAGDEKALQRYERSVVSGRTMDGIRKGDGIRKEAEPVRIDPSEVENAKKAAMPASLAPEKATLCDRLPPGDDWLFETKFDGYRLIAFKDRGKVRLRTGKGNDWTASFPAIREALERLPPARAVLDGEVVALTKEGGTSFQALQRVIKKADSRSPLAFMAFDLPYLDGYDLTRTPLLERKRLLEELIGAAGGNGVLRYSEHVRNVKKFFEFACRSQMEGVVCKQAGSPYRQRRTREWLKVKCLNRQEFVIGGYTEPSGARQGFGALLLGVYDDGGDLVYCGRVGTGFTQDVLKELAARLKRAERARSPFVDPPRGKGLHWTAPRLVAEVQFSEWTGDGQLRHPSFQGLRADKPPREIRREQPVTPPGPRSVVSSRASSRASDETTTLAGVRLTHPDRIMYPGQGLTKRALAEYHERVAERLLPHVRRRPLMLVRCPQGRGKPCFHQKHAGDSLSKVVSSMRVRTSRGMEDQIAIDDLAGLIGLVQFGTLEIHPWGCRPDDPESPDRLVFDLDPEESVDWGRVVLAARRLRDLMKSLDLTGFARTTGGKGLHIVFPLSGPTDWQSVRSFTGAVARELAGAWPEEYVATMSKRSRKGRIFIDHFRNARGATAVASYSPRARAGAPVATPLSWRELSAGMDRGRFTVKRLPRRLAAQKQDPWEGFFELDQPLKPSALRAVKAGKLK